MNMNVQTLNYVLTVVMFTYIPIIVFTNILVIFSICLFKQLRTAENFIIFNLAIADFITGAVTLPIYIMSYNPNTIYAIRGEKFTCWISTMIKSLSTQTSLMVLTLLCCDRSIALNWPTRYRKIMTKRNVILLAGAIWIFQSTQCFCIFFIMRFDQTVLPLSDRCSFYRNMPFWYRAYYTTIQIDGCLIISFVLSIQQIVVMCRKSCKRGDVSRSTLQQRRMYRDSASGSKVSTCLTTLFIFLWLPSILNTPLSHISNMTKFQLKLYRGASRLMRLGVAVVNAPIFAFCKKTNRRAYALMLSTPPWRWGKLEDVLSARMGPGPKRRKIQTVARRRSINRSLQLRQGGRLEEDEMVMAFTHKKFMDMVDAEMSDASQATGSEFSRYAPTDTASIASLKPSSKPSSKLKQKSP